MLPWGRPHGSWHMAEAWRCVLEVWVESRRCSHLAVLHLNAICQQLLRPGLVVREGQMESHLPALSHSAWVRSLVQLACLLRVSQGQNQGVGPACSCWMLLGITHL